MFVGRKNGVIYGAWSIPQPNDADHAGILELPDDHPDVVAFLAPKPVIPDPIDELRAALKTDPLLLDAIKKLK